MSYQPLERNLLRKFLGQIILNKYNIIFQILQKYFQNVKLFSFNPIKALMFMQPEYEFHKNWFDLWYVEKSLEYNQISFIWSK